MKINLGLVSIVGLCLVMVAYHINPIEGQLLDRILNPGNNEAASLDGQGNRQTGDVGSVFRKMMSVNVPGFYDMVKNGSSMGINVLSGMVRVDRGQEAERSGLQGRRPLSVRVFGVPVYERGHRNRNPNNQFDDDTTVIGSNKPGKNLPKGEGNDDEELPIDP